MKNRLLIFLVCFLLSCNGQGTYSKKTSIGQVEQEKMNDWQIDKNGCLKIRNKELAERLVAQNTLKSKSKEEFVKIFGEPNQTESEQEQLVLIYFFDCVCKDNKPIKGGDKCYANFYFQNSQLVKEIYICE